MKKAFILLLSIACTCLLIGCQGSPTAPNTLPPTIMVDDVLYYYTGNEISAEIDESAIIGKVESSVSLTKLPEKNGESNIAAEGSPYARYEDDIVVLMNEEWVLFELRD